MKRTAYIILASLILGSCSGKSDTDGKGKEGGQVPPEEEISYDSVSGLLMAGYQGWFTASGDGSPRGNSWYHYQESNTFEPGPRKNSIDFWPDVREYSNTYKTAFKHADGSPAYVYSAWDQSSVTLHFKWMRDYGIDGVFVQRFVSEVIKNPTGKAQFDKVLSSAMKASNHYKRAVCICYDLSGGLKYGGRTVDMVLQDAGECLEKYSLKDRTVQKYYLYENGKPLIAVWGAGFNDGRQYSLSDVSTLVDGLKNLGFSVMLGVPCYWRELFSDAVSDQALHSLVRKCDAIWPWTPGRFNSGGLEGYKFTIRQDVAWCRQAGVKYIACCFPGFSWENMRPLSGSTVSRDGGRFLWTQGYNAVKEGAEGIYIAMFDEMDEGTAIFKTLNASDVPSNVPLTDYYVCCSGGNYTISSVYKEVSGGWCRSAASLGVKFQGIEDDLPTDHYLWLSGKIGGMLKGDTGLSPEMPQR